LAGSVAEATPAIWRLLASGEDFSVGLSYLLHQGQVELRRFFTESDGRTFVICCARRYGKSVLCVELAVEQALRHPGSIVLYAAPTAKQVRTIVEPHMRRILADCPADLQPRHNRVEGEWRFPNGSVVRAAGCDGGNAERLRGTEAHLALVDEAGFVTDLGYVVQDVLMPQTLTTGGRILLVSTPSVTPAHDFAQYCEAAEREGRFVHRTIFDAPHINDALLDEYAAECGGRESSTWKREYEARFVTDTDWAVVPEFSVYEEQIVRELERPPYFHAYVGMDVGYKDLTVALLAYLHFDEFKLVIEDEVVLSGENSQVIAKAVQDKERELWSVRNKPVDHHGEIWEAYSRVVDAPNIVVADLNNFHGRDWIAAQKDDAAAALNNLRLAIASNKVVIHPRCKTLISHLRHAIWNKSRTSYERSGDFGHFDGVDALKYLLRAVDFQYNPYPPHWNMRDTENVWFLERGPATDEERLEEAFGLRRRG